MVGGGGVAMVARGGRTHIWPHRLVLAVEVVKRYQRLCPFGRRQPKCRPAYPWQGAMDLGEGGIVRRGGWRQRTRSQGRSLLRWRRQRNLRP